MRDIKVSLVGYGIVGHGVVDVLTRKREILRDMGLNLMLVSVTRSLRIGGGDGAACTIVTQLSSPLRASARSAIGRVFPRNAMTSPCASRPSLLPRT